ncbi:MAG: hypothetical protein HOJ07_06060 [Rhodospirillaceae bacterium]|jgi:hypothetical protein|nr:hypothetical protein [Rhodospirillaceae bacterium]
MPPSDLHLVLHGVAIKKHGTAEAVAAVTGLAEEAVDGVLAQALEKGRVVETQGAYMLTPAARMALDGEYSRVYAAERGDVAFKAAYEIFEALNRDLKQLMTEWQTVEVAGESVANDHSDEDYDAKMIDRLGDLHERAEGMLGDLTAILPRLSIYKDKLLVALEKAEDGETDWVSAVKIDSYHTVWFELHEDLLRVLGREREE